MKPLWEQTYSIWGQNLAVSALIAAIPTLVLLYQIGVRRKPAWVAGLWGLGTTLALALVGYHMPVALVLSSAGLGAAFGLLPISWIVFWAIVLYNITVATGKFTVVRESIGSLTPDLRIQAIIIAFGFNAFMEGAAGFGTPVAVAGAMMVGLGFSPYYAAALCLLANTAPVAFGGIGVPVITLAGVTGLSLERLTREVGLLCSPIALILPAYLIVTMGGFVSAMEIWPALAVAGVTFAGVQYFVSLYIGPELPVILGSITAMAALVGLLKVWRPRSRKIKERIDAKGERILGPFDIAGEVPVVGSRRLDYSPSEVLAGWLPYIILVCLVLLWGFKPVQSALNLASIPIRWPALHNLVLRMPPVSPTSSPYSAIFNLNLLSAAGTACMFASIISAIFLRMRFVDLVRVILASARQLAFPILTIVAVLAMAFLMNYSGATGTLGLALATTGRAFPFFSPFLGWLGVLLTGSDTSANALFGSLQVITANRLGFSNILIAGANSSGGVMGKMISLQSIAVAAAATGISDQQQSQVIRLTLKHSIFLTALVGVEVVLLAYGRH